jgi:hypothetical protein
MTTPAEIAASLSPAQKRYMLALPKPAWRCDSRSTPRLVADSRCGGLGLVEERWQREQQPFGMWYYPNAAGLQVRHILEQEMKES